MDRGHLRLTRIFRQNNVWETLQRSNDEYILYHLSPIRRNILEWFRFRENGKVLELNAQTGILTDMLCEKAGHVTAVVADKSDAKVNEVRNEGHMNLNVMKGKVDFDVYDQEFDYVTMIGVDRKFYNSCVKDQEPLADIAAQYRRMLCFAEKCLKGHGQLIVALNNRFGLQYWAGKADECSPKVYGSILGDVQNEYLFSKKRLRSMLEQAGFLQQQWYYPIPDYKYPLEIFSDGYLPGVGNIRPASTHYGREQYRVFDEKKVFDELCEEGMYEQFANSFLVICSKE